MRHLLWTRTTLCTSPDVVHAVCKVKWVGQTHGCAPGSGLEPGAQPHIDNVTCCICHRCTLHTSRMQTMQIVTYGVPLLPLVVLVSRVGA